MEVIEVVEATYGELVSSNEATGDAAELQRRLAADGYLFFRHLLPAIELQQLRLEIMSTLQGCGWLRADTDPMDGIAAVEKRTTEGDLSYTDVYHQVYRLEKFHRIAHSPDLLSLLEDVQNCPMMCQPQKVARIWFPQFTEHTTPTHQDFVHFQGSVDNLTCWSPVGDCPRELGGLAILRGSHQVNRILAHQFSLGAGSLHVEIDQHHELGDEWLTTDFEVGDTLIFNALTVHRALPNLTHDRLRVSLDNRYQRQADPIAEHMLQPHLSSMSPLDWNDVYSGWSDDSLQYYWKESDLAVVPKITKYLDAALEEAIQLTRLGDSRGELHLQRLATRAPHSPEGIRAKGILKETRENRGS